jgi:diguanylate cyclase (GGDEF)-like protein
MHRPDGILDSTSRWPARASIVGLLVILSFLAGFSVLTQQSVATRSERADRANRISEIYQDARFWVGQEESLERKYRLEPAPEVLGLHNAAGTNLVADLRRLAGTDRSAVTRAEVEHLLSLHSRYEHASAAMFRAVDAHHPALVIHFDHAVVDPVFSQLQGLVYRNAGAATSRALGDSAALRRDESAATRAIIIAFAIGLVLLGGFGLTLARVRRRLDGSRIAEVKRLAEIAITDPLTGLRNHRAFHEDLERSIQRVGRNNVPVSLVMLDLDGLKEVNDTLGHQAGDERLQALARALRSAERGADCAYRVGGDEFAVILEGTRAWGGLEFAQRLNRSLEIAPRPVRVSVSAGISDAIVLTDKDTLIREADLALIAIKRTGQQIAIYTREMEPDSALIDARDDEHYTQTLAGALALAVDAKDSYTRSHCQTVSQLCAVIAAELGLDEERLSRLRLAGLLHDVGKIGVPDAILNKPERLTEEEFQEMKTHPLLGEEIVAAADLATEAQWIRHHHERYDGNGYPDGLTGEAIPLESRIILVADAFEAMTSDRPYRDAPGPEYAVAELRRHAGRQFDPRIVDALCTVLASPAEPGVELATAALLTA